MGDAVAFTAAGLLALFGAARVVKAVRGDADPAQGYVGGFSLCLAASLVLLAPDVLAEADRLTGRPLLLILLGDALALAAAGFVVLLAVSLPGPPHPPVRQTVAAVAVQGVSAALFAAARPRLSDGVVHTAGAGSLLLAAHDVLFACYALYGLGLLARELTRGARTAPPGALRAGLRITTLAAVSAMAWTGWTVDDVVAVLAHGTQRGGDDAVTDVMAAVTALLTVGGATSLLWAGALGAPVRWLRARRRHRALEPLWAALHAVMPEIALASGEPAGLGRYAWRAEFALYRRIIEIRDGALALRPWADPRAAGWVAPQDGPADDAVAEAAGIAAALEHRASGGPRPCGGAGAARPYAVRPIPGTVDAEARWLVEVAAAFTGSPAVASVRDRVRSAYA